MFFVFSKLLLIFILPLSWIIATFFAALIVKNKKIKKRLAIISFALLLIFTNPFLINFFASKWDIKQAPLNKNGPYSCVIVLGGFSGEGPNRTGYFNGACDRFIEGLKLTTTHRAGHILISGGNGNLIHDNFYEGDWVEGQLKQMNVPDSSILIEDRSRNTLENAAFSKIILQKKHLQPPYILVTSAFHMRRSLGIFNRAKIDVVPYSCNLIAGNPGFSMDQFIPDADALGKWNIYIKEVIGITVNIFKK